MRTQYPGLDLIRFAAALLVTVFHLGYLWWVDAGDAAGAQIRADLAPLAPFVSSGWVGVPIFFMLSGFVIAFSAHDRSARQFAVGRAARLYPAAWLCALVTSIAVAPDLQLSRKLAASLSLWPIGPWISGVYWTLAIEIMFYLLVAVLLATRRPRALDDLGVWLSVLGSAYWLLRLADYATGSRFKAAFGLVEGPLGGLLLIGNAVHFGFGLLLWSATRQGVTWPRVALMVGCVTGGVVSVAASARFNIALHGGPTSRLVVGPSIYLAGSGAIVAAVAANGWLMSRLGRWTPTARTLGLLTYPLYLVHSEVGERVMRAVAGLGGWMALTIGFAVVITIGVIVLQLERYPRRLILKLAESMQARRSIIGDLP